MKIPAFLTPSVRAFCQHHFERNMHHITVSINPFFAAFYLSKVTSVVCFCMLT